LKRRDFLRAAMVASAVPLGGCPVSFEQGLFNECRDPRPRGAAALLVANAWNRLHADQVWDVHAHLLGNGRGGSGIFIDPAFDQPRWPAAFVRRRFFMNAACVPEYDDRLDGVVLTRLTALADTFPPGVKLMLLAFDMTYDESGKARPDLTSMAVPNEYAQRIAAARPDRFEWIASVHPYRADAADALRKVKAAGARAIKWLPPTMAIDMASPRCRPFYETLRGLDLPLLVHVGDEQALVGAGRDELGKPDLLRHPLDAGVRVIAAHCATLGDGSFDAFARLMNDHRHEKTLFADISAVTQLNREKHLPAILERKDWHPRLLNGSDYPLPGVMPIFSLKSLASIGVLDLGLVPALRELRQANSLLFDFVLKRNLNYKGARFADGVFETRRFFEKGAGRSG
jgi:mannonate dehydratase